MENMLYIAWPSLKVGLWSKYRKSDIPSQKEVYDRFSELFRLYIMDINNIDSSYVKKALGGRKFWEPSMQ